MGCAVLACCLGAVWISIKAKANGRQKLALLGLGFVGIYVLAGIWASFQTTEPDFITEKADFGGVVELESDPRSFSSGVSFRASLKSEGERKLVEVLAFRGQGHKLQKRLAGELVYLEGELRPFNASGRRLHFGIEGQLLVKSVGGHNSGALHYRASNILRRTIEKGAESLGDRQRALLTGLIYGDDRHQSLVDRDLFRSVGLTHILAVSGQNVAFVLALTYPLVRKLKSRSRWILVVLVLGIFASATRFEPSVLRSTAMVLVALFLGGGFSFQMGKNRTIAKAALPIAVLCLLAVSPQIAGRLAFQLSVLASMGIIFLARPLAEFIRGPRWLAVPLAVTLSAQAFVSPLLVWVFGGIAVAVIPANMLALPAVGLATSWGLSAGLAAGSFGSSIAGLLHLPTRLFVNWIYWTARWSGELNLGWLGFWHLLLLMACIGAAIGVRRRGFRVLACAVSLLVLASPAVFLRVDNSGPETIGDYENSELWRTQGLLVLRDDAAPSLLLDALRLKGISQLQLVVFTKEPNSETARSLKGRYQVDEVWVPRGHYLAGASSPEPGAVYELGDLLLFVLEVEPEISLEVCRRLNKGGGGDIPLGCGTALGQKAV